MLRSQESNCRSCVAVAMRHSHRMISTYWPREMITIVFLPFLDVDRGSCNSFWHDISGCRGTSRVCNCRRQFFVKFSHHLPSTSGRHVLMHAFFNFQNFDDTLVFGFLVWTFITLSFFSYKGIDLIVLSSVEQVQFLINYLYVNSQLYMASKSRYSQEFMTAQCST